ncbi:hypothetical protein J3R83DRAFT_3360, partial [Lanmaoa asiatica]
GEDTTAKSRDLWPESTAQMYFEVLMAYIHDVLFFAYSVSPYCAPELLFSLRTYNAFAINTWSLGVTFSEFFTSLHLQTAKDKDHENLS